MRVGVYVDAFNLYYGGRGLCSRGTAGWRWLSIEALSSSLVDRSLWPEARLERIAYCTALRARAGDPTSLRDQETYLSALRTSVTRLECVEGEYVPRVKRGHLVRKNSPKRVSPPADSGVPEWLPLEPVAGPEGQTVLLASVTTFEEKGSDVNVAARLLVDVLTDVVDAAIVFSNDSDLRLPLREARLRVPVGTVNPGPRPTAEALKGQPSDGVGRHWWRRLGAEDFTSHQMPNPCGGVYRPDGW